jgi:hypothetical protein
VLFRSTPANPCEVSRCNSSTGCGVEAVPDGTLCGVDDCLATQVDVCVAGACVRRIRPDTGRCANRWVPTAIPGRRKTAMAWDPVRQRLVLFGGDLGGELARDTWEWDGSSWSQKTPASSPPALSDHAMAWDGRRIILFGGRAAGGFLQSDTWEWTGATWVRRSPLDTPPARWSHAMTWDAHRQRVVLFGGAGTSTELADTWEWDGFNWLERHPALSPFKRSGHAMAYDATRRRVVLFGGLSGGALADTWEWDGSNWLQHTAKIGRASCRERVS